VLPEPWRPASRITVGGRPANASFESPLPIAAVSSSWTIFTTCWPGVRLFSTSAPSARSRTRATKSLTTAKLTSASSSARRISRIAFEIASSSSLPRERRSPSAACSLSPSVSNTGPVYARLARRPLRPRLEQERRARRLREVEVPAQIAQDAHVLAHRRPRIRPPVRPRIQPLPTQEVVLHELQIRIEAQRLMIHVALPRI